MKPSAALLLTLLLLALAGCATARLPDRTDLVGRWRMGRISDGGRDVTAVANPSRNRWIEFRADGRFAAGGDPYGPSAGRWSYAPATGTLTLDTDGGSASDSRWVVAQSGGTMRWRGTGSSSVVITSVRTR